MSPSPESDHKQPGWFCLQWLTRRQAPATRYLQRLGRVDPAADQPGMVATCNAKEDQDFSRLMPQTFVLRWRSTKELRVEGMFRL